MDILLKIFIAVVCAVGGAIGGGRWIDNLYPAKKQILSFPAKIYAQAQTRRRYLPAALGMLFAFYLLSHELPVTSYAFHLLYIYFLVLFTVTDCEQQVIFDVMLIPFALLGLIFCLADGLPLVHHLAAALGGGLLFLLLAVLTRGGVGGGDIKLIAGLGLWLGVNSLLHVVVCGLIAGGLGALFLLIVKHKKRTDTFAYGPFFTLAALLQLYLG